ncbi:MAG: OstA-like protein [Flavobacteriales bacterium]
MRLTLLFGFVFVLKAFLSQGKLELLPGSEKIYFDKATQTHRLVGTVSFIYQGNTMYCDSAHYRERDKIVRAYGRVHITKEDVNLYCDSLVYSGSTKIARLWGHVNVRDSEYKLSSDSLEYNAKTGRAIYRNNGKIENSTNKEVITSKLGYFYPSTGTCFFSGKVKYKKQRLTMTTDTLQFIYEKQTTFFHGPTTIKNDSIEIQCEKGQYRVDIQEGLLRKNVFIQQKDRTIYCDTAFYKETNQLFNGNGHVRIYEKNQHLILLGDYFHAQNNVSQSTLAGHALVIETKQKDSLFLHADTIRMQKDSLDERNIYGSNGVKIFSKKAQAICDSAHYSSKIGVIDLFQKPILWAQNGELKGDSIRVFLKDSVIEKALILGNASSIMNVDSDSCFNQLSGKRIDAWFKESLLFKAKVSGQAWTIFYPIEEQQADRVLTRKRKGLNRLFASELIVYLDSGEVSKITFFDKPDGVFFPMEQIDEKERFIKNFSWNPLLRPRNPYAMVHKTLE